MKKNLKNLKHLLLAVFVLSVSFLYANPAQAQIEELILRVDGLACPFCAYGLEKKVMKIEGASSYDVDMKEGKVHIKFDKDAVINLSNIRSAVKEAGFTLRAIFLRANGRIEKTDTDFVLIVGGRQEKFLLFESEAQADKYHQGKKPGGLALSKAVSEKLTAYAHDQKQVQIVGAVHEHDGLPAGLSIEKIEILK